MSEVNNRRRGYWIDSRFQGKLIGMVLAVLVTMAVGTLVLWSSSMTAVTAMSPKATSGISPEIVMLILLIMILVVTTVGYGLRFSHRIIGPIYAFNRHLNWIKEGNYTRDLKLRKGDEFNNLQTTFNAMQSTLRRRSRENLEALDRLAKLATELDGTVQAETAAPGANGVLQEIRTELGQLKRKEEGLLAS